MTANFYPITKVHLQRRDEFAVGSVDFDFRIQGKSIFYIPIDKKCIRIDRKI